MSKLGKRLFGISLGLALFAVTAEAAVRYGRPMPRGQIIRSTGKSAIAKTMRDHGQPVWEEMAPRRATTRVRRPRRDPRRPVRDVHHLGTGYEAQRS